MDQHDIEENLWEHRVRFDQALKGMKIELVADDARRAAIAKGFGMVSLDSLKAEIETRSAPSDKPMVQVTLKLTGAVTQECGVSLEPFSHPIAADLTIDCIEKGRVTDEVAEIGAHEFTLDDLDEPDVIENGQIDLGQYVIEALGEAYDPFARKPGVVFQEPEVEKEPSPFAVLAKLKRDE
ncbi:DUF177 domain-containing protein [Asticcacaulis sp. 201]|uniref:YceD family protein n=1 Tax=Asticcacaulis sp. 201 TaxID=3028787 RepID=UPI00291626B8|nr:DUF177 domain-containing protein [Asticcacaulis sp. 201]MDV6329287.1 DUF177 domain-containing protein [Asticcacaulis sp. 201]